MSFPFQSSGISWASLNRAAAIVGGWKELGRTTLASVNDNISVGSLADKRYYMLLAHTISSGATRHGLRMNSDTAGNYAWRISDNGAADSTVGSSARIIMQGNNPSTDEFSVGYCSNLSTKEKLFLSHTSKVASTGATSSSNRSECSAKHSQTSNPIDNFTLFNSESGDYASDSELVVLGWDKDDTHTDNFWELVASKELTSSSSTFSFDAFTPKKYMWLQTWFQDCNNDPNLRVGSSGSIDTGTNYSYRRSINGAADTTNNSKTDMGLGSTYTGIGYASTFIINVSSKEKQFIHESVRADTTGAGTAPDYRTESVGKWANTSAQFNIMDWYKSSITFGAGCKMMLWGAD